MKARGHAAADIEDVLDELSEQRLQSDARYAEAYARSRAERGYGLRRIAAELKQRGASAEAIQRALNDIECDWLDLASRADRKKFGAVPDPGLAVTVKRRRYLEDRGFAADQIKAILNADHELD